MRSRGHWPIWPSLRRVEKRLACAERATLNLPLESANPHPGPGVLPAPPFPRSERDWSSIPQDAWGAAASYAKRRGARAAPVESRDGPSNYSDVD